MNGIVYFSNGKIWYIRAKSIYIKITRNIFVIFLYPSMCGVSFDILFLLNSFVEMLPIIMTCIKNMHFLSLLQKMFLLGMAGITINRMSRERRNRAVHFYYKSMVVVLCGM